MKKTRFFVVIYVLICSLMITNMPIAALGLSDGLQTGLATSSYEGTKTNAEFAGGNGTENNPYLISTPEQLNNVRNHLSSHFKQICDIDMSSISNWQPIGNACSITSESSYAHDLPEVPYEPFCGSYDGSGYNISNLSINNSSVSPANDCYGLFAALDDCVIKNINLVELDYSINKATTDYAALWNEYGERFSVLVGGIAGRSFGDSEIINCTCSGSISLVNCNDAYVGGILGCGYLKAVSKCANYTDIYINANKPSIDDKDSLVSCGGIVGESYSISILSECLNKGNINIIAGEALECGGITSWYCQIENCVNAGNIEGHVLESGFCSAGGIVGISDYTKRCVNYGNVCFDSNSTAYTSAGGIAGYSIYNRPVTCCVNIGKSILSAESDNQNVESHAGRIVGEENYVNECFSLDSTIVNGSTVTGNSNDHNGESVSASELLTQTPYHGFDFDNIWTIDENMGGAVLKRYYANNECTGYHNWEFDNENICFVCSECGKHQYLSPVLDYRFGRDSFSFSNSDLASYDISFAGYYYMNPALKLDVASLLANKVNRLINYYVNGSTYGGSCFGIAAMNASFFAGMSTNDFGAIDASLLSIENADSFSLNYDTKLKDAINIMFLSQSSSGFAFFEQFQDGATWGDKNFKDIVDVAKNLKKGDYPPIVTFKISEGGHAVNIIGIEPDDFVEDRYWITTYDSNNPDFASFIGVQKDYSGARFVFWSQKNSRWEYYDIESISYFVKSKSFSIDYWAPGLRTSHLYGKKNTKKNVNTNKSYFEYSENTHVQNEDYISFIISNDSLVTITTPSGKTFSTDANGSYSSDITSAVVVPFIGTTLTKTIIPYEIGEYSVSCDQSFFININYNQNAATLFSEDGCDIVYSPDGFFSYTPKTPNEYIEAAYYKYDLLNESDAIGIELQGEVSNKTSLICKDKGIKILGNDIGEQSLNIQHNDYEMTNETLCNSITEDHDGIIISNTDHGIVVSPSNGNLPVHMIGDANGDGVVDSLDVLRIVRYAVGIESINEDLLELCNVNGDDSINLADALFTLRYVFGIIGALPNE